MLAHLRAPTAALRSTANASAAASVQVRKYSYFSQRPGRFFTSSKPAASTTAYARRTRLSGMRRSSEASGAVSSTTASADGVADGSLAAAGATTVGASSAGADSASATSSSGSGSLSSASETHSASSAASSFSSSARYSSIPATAPLFHPQPSLPSLHLHDLFSQHRPLLLLDQPLANLFSPLQRSSSLFSSSTSSRDLPTSPDPFASLSESQARIEDAANARALSQLDFDTTAPADRSDKSAEAADEDVMRFLAHSLVQQKIQANNEWSAIERRLGLETPAEVKDAQATEQVMVAAENESTPDFVVSLDSVKRKRRKKMNKHKYKKRRKEQRAERRRLGK